MPDPTIDPVGAYWANGPAGGTARNAANLNARESKLYDEATAYTDALLAQSLYDSGSHSAAFTLPLMVAPFPCTIARLAAVQPVLGTGGSSNTNVNYWVATLAVYREGTRVGTVAAKSTQTGVALPGNGGEAFVAMKAWTFDAVVFDATYSTLQLSDVLAVEWTIVTTGTAPSPVAATAYTWRVEPV